MFNRIENIKNCSIKNSRILNHKSIKIDEIVGNKAEFLGPLIYREEDSKVRLVEFSL